MRFTEHERVKWTSGGMLFTWDDRKAASNLKKHGVRFSEAAARHATKEEERYYAYGLA